MWHDLLAWLPGRPLPLMPEAPVGGAPSSRPPAVDRPPETALSALPSLWDRITADPALARLADALERCELQPLLSGDRPMTLFAPVNAGLDRAAARLGLGASQLWRRTDLLRALLLHHFVPGAWPSAHLPWPGEVDSLAGRPIRLTALGLLHSGDLALGLAPRSDDRCRNGLLHRIPEVLLPPDD